MTWLNSGATMPMQRRALPFLPLLFTALLSLWSSSMLAAEPNDIEHDLVITVQGEEKRVALDQALALLNVPSVSIALIAARSSRADVIRSSSSSVCFWISLFFPPVRFLRASSMSVGSRARQLRSAVKNRAASITASMASFGAFCTLMPRAALQFMRSGERSKTPSR